MAIKSWLQWEVGETTNKLVFNITYCPIFWKLKNILSKIHREHSKGFENISMTGFKKEKSLKDILVRAKVPTEECFCGPCNKSRCETCKHVTKIHRFESTSTSM